MTEDLTAEAILEFPQIFKLAAERRRGSQTLSVERTPTGITVEVVTDLSGVRYQVVTSGRDDNLPTPADETERPVHLYVDDQPEGSHSWERTPSDGSWQISLAPEAGLFVHVFTAENPPPAEVRLTRTTINQELPAPFRR